MSCPRPRSANRSPRPTRPAPVRSAADALDVIALVAARPPTPETIGFLLDSGGHGSVITVVSGTADPAAVLSVAECLAEASTARPDLCGLVLATIRPWGGVVPADIDRWLEACQLTEQSGIELIEWFVIGHDGPECPRDLLGQPERWPR